MAEWPGAHKHLCNLCDKRIGLYSLERDMFICPDCLHAMGRQDITYQRAIAELRWIEHHEGERL